MLNSRLTGRFTVIIYCLAAIAVFADCGKKDAEAEAEAEATRQAAKKWGTDTMTIVEGYRMISASKAGKMAAESANAVLLDVRSEEEFRERRIKGAVLLPVGEIRDRAASVLPDKGAVILVYCRRGVRSKVAANTLLSMGYTNVYDFGGIGDWKGGVETK